MKLKNILFLSILREFASLELTKIKLYFRKRSGKIHIGIFRQLSGNEDCIMLSRDSIIVKNELVNKDFVFCFFLHYNANTQAYHYNTGYKQLNNKINMEFNRKAT